MSAAVLQADRTSVRAKSKGDALARKAAFRTVLDNPLQLSWPAPSGAVRRILLEELLAFLASAALDGQPSIPEWKVGNHARRRDRTAGAGKGKGKEGVSAEGAAAMAGEKCKPDDDDDDDGNTQPKPTHSPLARPAVLDHITVGINDCTRALESRIRWGRWELGDPTAAPPLASTSQAAPADRRRGHKRKHSSRANSPASRLEGAANITVPEPAKEGGAAHPPGLEFLSEPARELSASLPPFLRTTAPDGSSVRILANHQKLRAAKSGSTHMQAPATLPLVDLVFVCRPDLNPTSLVAHLPSMAAAANGVRQALEEKAQTAEKRQQNEPRKNKGDEMDVDLKEEGAEGKVPRPETRSVFLVPLDVGAEQALAAALALRRVACIGIDSHAPHAERLLALVSEHINPLTAHWLVPHLTNPPAPVVAHSLIPTHVKHLRTTAPLNPKAAQAAKKQAKLDAKAQKASKQAESKVYVAEED